mgnify:CR=1 FL=1
MDGFEFAVVGAGWRTDFFLRVAAALPQVAAAAAAPTWTAVLELHPARHPGILRLSTLPVVVVAMVFGRYIRRLMKQRQEQLAKTVLRAPMDGEVTRMAVEVGEVAVPGTFSRETGLLMTISDLTVIQVNVRVDETDVVRHPLVAEMLDVL